MVRGFRSDTMWDKGNNKFHFITDILDSVGTVLKWSRTMAWKEISPVGYLLDKKTKKKPWLMQRKLLKIEENLSWDELLPKYRIRIQSRPVWFAMLFSLTFEYPIETKVPALTVSQLRLLHNILLSLKKFTNMKCLSWLIGLSSETIALHFSSEKKTAWAVKSVNIVVG